MASISTLDNILGQHLKTTMLSGKYVLYPPEIDGIITSDNFLENANVDEYERQGWGVVGISHTEQIFKNQPWSRDFDYQEVVNRMAALIRDLDPNITEDTAAGLGTQFIGGAIGLAKEIDMVVNQLDRNRLKFIKSLLILDSGKNKLAQSVPNAGSGATNISGVAKRGFMSRLPTVVEGWNYQGCAVTPSAAPDANTLTAAGQVYLRNTTATCVSRKTVCSGGTIIHNVVALNPRWDAIVAFETTSAENPVGIMVVEGAEAVGPVVPTPAEIQTAVDAATFAGSRWCRIADIDIQVGALAIDATHIIMYTTNTFTYRTTPLILSPDIKSDGYFIHDYLIQYRQQGVLKTTRAGITTEDATNLILNVATGNMIEAIYSVESANVWDELEAQA